MRGVYRETGASRSFIPLIHTSWTLVPMGLCKIILEWYAGLTVPTSAIQGLSLLSVVTSSIPGVLSLLPGWTRILHTYTGRSLWFHATSHLFWTSRIQSRNLSTRRNNFPLDQPVRWEENHSSGTVEPFSHIQGTWTGTDQDVQVFNVQMSPAILDSERTQSRLRRCYMSSSWKAGWNKTCHYLPNLHNGN